MSTCFPAFATGAALLLPAVSASLHAAPASAPVPPQTARTIAALYARYDAAYAIRNEARFRRAVGALLAPDFTVRSETGAVTARGDWLRERTAAASLGPPPWPGNTGGFRTFDRLEVRSSTVPGSMTGDAACVSIYVTESVSTSATGRREPAGPRESTGAVFTTEARDHWRRAKGGWIWERRDILARRAMSSISMEAPVKAPPAPERRPSGDG